MTTYEETLKELALADTRIVVMTAENRAPVRSLPQALRERFIDTGITEQCMVGAAAGLALRGRHVVAHALATFLTMRAFEFIRTDIGISGLPVKLVGFVPGFLSDGNGPTHQAIEDIAILRGIPSMRIFCPADHEELVAGLPTIVRDSSPWYIRYNTRRAVVAHSARFEIGKAETLTGGDDVALLVYGMLFQEAWEATHLLRARGIGVRLVNLRTVKPLDETAVVAAISSTKLTVTLEDHLQIGGLYSMVAEVCLQRRLAPRVFPIALDNRWFKPGRLGEVLEHEGFTGAGIAERILSQLVEA